MMVTGDGSSDPWREHGSEKGDAAAAKNETINHRDRKQVWQLPIQTTSRQTDERTVRYLETNHPMQAKKWHRHDYKYQSRHSLTGRLIRRNGEYTIVAIVQGREIRHDPHRHQAVRTTRNLNLGNARVWRHLGKTDNPSWTCRSETDTHSFFFLYPSLSLSPSLMWN